METKIPYPRRQSAVMTFKGFKAIFSDMNCLPFNYFGVDIAWT